MVLDPELRKEISDFLMPHFDSPDERRDLVHYALFESSILNLINWEGSASQFTYNLIDTLERFGDSEEIRRLLDSLRERHGPDIIQQIDDLITKLSNPSLPEKESILPIDESNVSSNIANNPRFSLYLLVIQTVMISIIAISALLLLIMNYYTSIIFPRDATDDAERILTEIFQLQGSSTETSTSTASNTPTETSTLTTTWTPTPTPTPTTTNVPQPTACEPFRGQPDTCRDDPTLTPVTNTPTATDTPTATNTPRLDINPLVTPIPSTVTNTEVSTSIPTSTWTSTSTMTPSAVPTLPTDTPTATATNTPTVTNTPRLDINPLVTPIPPTAINTEVTIPTSTWTSTPTEAVTSTVTRTLSATPILSTATPTMTDTMTETMTETVTSTVTDTPEPILTAELTETVIAGGTQVALQQTQAAIPIAISVTDTPNDSVGDANVSLYYDNEVAYPNTTTVELSLIFISLYITPTPISTITRVTITPSVPLPTVVDSGFVTSTRSPQTESNVDKIPPNLIAVLVCSERSFEGCEAHETRPVEIGIDNRWEWILSPNEQVSGQQNLRLELYEANELGERVGNPLFEPYRFTINVKQSKENPIIAFFTQDVDGTIIGFLVLAILGGVVNVLKNEYQKRRNSTQTTSEKDWDIDNPQKQNILGRLYENIKSILNRNAEEKPDDES